MKILSIGLDKTALEKDSSLSKRVIEYGDLVEKFTVIVPSNKVQKNKLNAKINIYGTGGKNKVEQIVKIWQIANKILKKEKYDVITVQDQYYIGLLALLIKLRFRIGLEIQIHGFEKYVGIRKIIANFLIPRVNSIRVVSERLGRQIINEFRVEKDKVTVVPIYTEVESRSFGFAQDRKSKVESRNDDKIIFMYAGRFVEVKNIEMQILAIKNLQLKIKNIELWLVGDGGLSRKLKVKSRKLGVEKKVKFISWQDNLDDIYRKVDCFLLTSNYEGWGLVAIEAASHGLPVIMTDVGCAGEVIVNNESGIVISVGNKVALEEAMLKLAGDAGLRKRLGENAIKAVEKLPNKEETLKLYRKSWEKATR